MRLYQGNAKDLVGKKTDCGVRRFGYHPMAVIKTNGELYVKDVMGTCMSVPKKETDSNCRWSDFVIGQIL